MIDFTTLDSLCISIFDCPHSTPDWKSEGFPVIRNYNIKDGTIDINELSYVDENTYIERTKRAIPEENDIVISREAPMGKACIIPKNFKCCLGQRLVLLKVNKEICNPLYLLYALSSDFVQKQINRINLTGSIVSNLNISALKELIIPVIPLSEQDKISECLASLDKKIQNNKKQIETLESLAKTIYDYWFMQFDFPNEEGKPYKSSGGKMVWNEELKREIPDSWSCVQLSAVFSFIKGKLPEKIFATKEKGLEPYITIDVANGGHPLYCSPKNMILCNSESIMVMDGAASGDVYIGPKGILGSTFSMIKLKRSDVSNSLIYMMLSSLKKSYVRANTGSTVPHANIRYIEQLKVAIPKNCLALSERIDASFENINLLKKQIQELYSLKLFLLPLLMNGQVSLSKKYAQNFEAVLK